MTSPSLTAHQPPTPPGFALVNSMSDYNQILISSQLTSDRFHTRTHGNWT
jgi:hypothetical protein